MKTTSRKIGSLVTPIRLIALACVAFCASVLFLGCEDNVRVTGTWEGKTSVNSRSRSLRFDLREDDGQVTGTVDDRAASGTIEGNHLVLTCSYVIIEVVGGQDATATDVYDGTVRGNSIAGTFTGTIHEWTIFGETTPEIVESGTFTVSRTR